MDKQNVSTGPSGASQTYTDARMKMEAYLERIKRGKTVLDELKPLRDLKTNKITRYI